MEKLNHFKEESLLDSDLQKVLGGKEIDTWLGGTKEKPHYTDVHYDNDNNGKWSQGDDIIITKKVMSIN